MQKLITIPLENDAPAGLDAAIQNWINQEQSTTGRTVEVTAGMGFGLNHNNSTVSVLVFYKLV